MFSEKYETAGVTSVGFASGLYKNHGIMMVVTDGKYIQLDKEKEHESNDSISIHSPLQEFKH
jgi:hypothetical protein